MYPHSTGYRIDEESAQHFFSQSVMRNKLVFAIAGVLFFLIGCIFPAVEIFGLHEALDMPVNPYPWHFGAFFWSITLLLLYLLQKQRVLERQGLPNEDRMVEKMVRKTDLAISTRGLIKIYKVPLVSTSLISLAALAILYATLAMFFLGGEIEHLWNQKILFTHRNLLATMAAVFLFIQVFIVFFLTKNVITVTRDYIEKRKPFSRKPVRFLINDTEEFRIATGPVVLNHVTAGKYFELEVIDSHNTKLLLRYEYHFNRIHTDLLGQGHILFWLYHHLQSISE